MTGYQDYLIVLSPPESVISRMKQYKHNSAEIIGDYDGRHSMAHITIQRLFRKKPQWIEPMLPKLVRDMQHLPPVVLDINGFNYFDHPEKPTIYARLTSTPATKVWFKQLRRFFSTPDFEPHITLARSIPHAAFKDLWPHFRNLEWKEQMKISKLTILCRETIGYNRSYKKIKEIPFNDHYDFHAFTNSKLLPANATQKQAVSEQFSLF